MKKLFITLLCFLILAWVSSQAGVIEVPNASAFIFISGKPVSGVLECVSGTTFSYTGDHSSGVDYACDSAQAGLDGTQAGNVTVSSDYVTYENDAYVSWSVDAGDEMDDSQGTICFSAYNPDADTDTNWEDNGLVEYWSGGNNHWLVTMNDTGDIFQARHEGGGNEQTIDSAGSHSLDTWYRVCYSWQTGDAGGGKHDLSVAACDPNTVAGCASTTQSWVGEETEDLDNFAVQPSDFKIGDWNSNLPTQDEPRVADVTVTSGYKDADPF